MSAARIASTLALVALAGCALLTGAADLTTDPSIGPGGVKVEPTADGSSGSDGGVSDSSSQLDSTPNDAAVNPSDAATDGPPLAGLRAITFENGTLTGSQGADTVSGNPTCVTAGALRGSYSMKVSAASSYVDVSFPAQGELYVSFVFSVAAFAGGPGLGNPVAPIARFSFANSATTIDVGVSAAGININAGESNAILGGVSTGITYRFGLHIKQNGGQSFIEPQLVQGASTAFGAASTMIAITAIGDVDRVSFGGVGTNAITAYFDQLLLDPTSMPAP